MSLYELSLPGKRVVEAWERLYHEVKSYVGLVSRTSIFRSISFRADNEKFPSMNCPPLSRPTPCVPPRTNISDLRPNYATHHLL